MVGEWAKCWNPPPPEAIQVAYVLGKFQLEPPAGTDTPPGGRLAWPSAVGGERPEIPATLPVGREVAMSTWGTVSGSHTQ